MSTIADSAVGAILEIPPTALNQIYKAQRAIEGLQMTSKHAAEEVSKHWGTTALDGLTKFINQVNEAKTKMGSLGDIKFNINLKDSGLSSFTQGLNQSANTIAQIAQQLAQIAPNANATAISLGNVSEQIKKAFPYEANKNIDQLSTAIKNINDKLIDSQGGVPRRADEQYLVNLRARYQEELKILNQCDSKRQEISDKDAQRKQRELERNSEIGRRRNEQYNRDVEAERMLDNARKKAFDDYERRIQKEEQAKQRQAEAQRQFNQALREADASRIAKAEADAQRQTTEILSRKVSLQQKITELETKQSMATAKIGPALTSKESGDLTRYTAEMSRLDSQLTALSSKYPKMVADVNRAFDVRKIEMFTDAYNRFNEALSKSQTAKHDTAESKLNQLYADRLRIVKEITQLNNTGMLNISKGASQPLSADQNRLLQDLQTKLAGVDREIGTIANSYRGLALKAKNAYAIEELRQAIKLQEQYEKQLAAIESRGVKSQLADYKRLTAEAQKLAQSMREYTLSGGDKSSAAYTQLEQRFRTVMSERRVLEMKNIDEINAYRQQRQMAAYQDDLSRFVQAEAQKRTEQQRTIDEQVAKAKIAGQQYAQSFQGAWHQYENLMSGSGKGKLAVNLENIKRVLADLQTAAGKLNLLDPSDEAKAKHLRIAIQALSNMIKKYKDVTSTKIDKPVINPQDAINAAKNARTLKELQDAYKNLKTAMSTLDPKSSLWQQANTVLGKTKEEIDKIRIAMGELQAQSKKTSNDFSQLKGQLGAVFSVAAITGYIKKMVEVRAQFELQNVALRAILQNKDEADQIFMQVQQMALQSPFTIMQLTTYTKQLAAYRIESEKLVGTTKMLADVSAGLGVDMQRLILAYGQVKAANYLRATEVRQFTEAGLNIAGELANYFSELQGKMISVGDVMEMITKRMVRFEDVEEVFRRVTSAGGLFYDMQKKQAETLSGQMQRITDAYNIMLNEIGKNNQGTIASALTAIRSLISHWRMFVPIIKEVGYLMAGIFAVKGIIALIGQFTKLGTAVLTVVKALRSGVVAANALNMAFSTTGIGALITLTLTAVAVFQGLNAEANALREHLASIGQESLSDMTASIDRFKELANTIRDTNATFKERNEAYEEMVRTYSDILPAYALEREYIQSLGSDYNGLTKEIRKYYQQRELEKKIETTKSESKDYEKMQKHLKGLGERMFRGEWFDKSITQSMVNGFMQKLGDELASGETEATMEAVLKRFREHFGEHLKEIGKVTDWWGKDYREGSLAEMLSEAYGLDDMSDAFDRVAKFKNEIDGLIYSLSTAGSIDEQISASRRIRAEEVISKAEEESKAITGVVSSYYELQKKIENLKAVENPTDAQKDSLKALEKSIVEVRAEILKYSNDFKLGINESTLEGIKDIGDLNSLLEVIRDKAMPQFAAAGVNALGLITDEAKPLLAAVNEILAKLNMAQVRFKNESTQEDYMTNYVETTDYQKTRAEQIKEQQEAELKSQQDLNDKIIKEESNRYKVSSKLFDTFRIEQGRSSSEYAKDLIGKAEEIESKINNLRAARNKGVLEDYEKTSGMSYSNLEQYEQEAKAFRAVATKYQPYDKNADKKAAKDALKDLKENLKNQQKALEDFYKRYQELRKNFSVGESERQDISAFTDLFKKVSLKMDDVIKEGFDTDGLIRNLEKLKATVPAELKDIIFDIQKSISDNSVKLKVEIAEKERETLQRDIDDMFANMELTKTFSDFGLNVDLTYVVGGKPTTLADIRSQLESMSTDMAKKSLEEQKIYQKALEQLRKKEHSNQIERIKSYNKYLISSYSEAAKIQLDYYAKLETMQKDFAKMQEDLQKELANPETSNKDKLEIERILDTLPEQGRRASQNLRLEMEKELDKLSLDKLLKSPLFSEMFQDLGSMTNQVLDSMLNKIRDIQKSANDLTLSQVRQLAQYAEKIENAKIDNSPFKEAYNAIKKAYELRSQGITAKGASDALAVSEAELDRLEILKEDLALVLGIKEKAYQINGDTVIAGEQELKLTDQQLSLIKKTTSELNKKSQTTDKDIADMKKVVTVNAQNVQTFKNAKEGTEKFGAALQEAAKLGIAGMNAITAGIQMFGHEIGEEDQVWIDFVANMLSSCITLGIAFVALGVQINEALGVIGLIATALSIVTQLFTAIFQAHDKRLEKQISNIQAKVDSLRRNFDRLNESVNNAFKSDALKRDSDLALKNLEEQKKATEEMMRLEQAKKKTDEEQIKKYKEELEDLDETIQEIQETVIEKWGGFGSQANFASASEAFATSWLDAYKTTGNGLDALEEQWDEYVDNLISKQLMLRVIGPRMEKLLKTVDQYVSKGSEEDEHLSRNEMEALRNLKENLFSNINDEAKQLMEILGIKPGGDYILSDLQKGIQNITEPQAAAIEAYLNSMRFAVFQHTEQLDTLIATIQAQYGSGAENPVVTELKGIRTVLDRIDNRLASVIDNRVGRGGAAVRIAG